MKYQNQKILNYFCHFFFHLQITNVTQFLNHFRHVIVECEFHDITLKENKRIESVCIILYVIIWKHLLLFEKYLESCVILNFAASLASIGNYNLEDHTQTEKRYEDKSANIILLSNTPSKDLFYNKENIIEATSAFVNANIKHYFTIWNPFSLFLFGNKYYNTW